MAAGLECGLLTENKRRWENLISCTVQEKEMYIYINVFIRLKIKFHSKLNLSQLFKILAEIKLSNFMLLSSDVRF